MNARTSRLVRRVAFAVHQVESTAARANGKSPMSVAPFRSQLKSIKEAWNKTPRSQRGATRHRLVGIFHDIVNGGPRG